MFQVRAEIVVDLSPILAEQQVDNASLPAL